MLKNNFNFFKSSLLKPIPKLRKSLIFVKFRESSENKEISKKFLFFGTTSTISGCAKLISFLNCIQLHYKVILFSCSSFLPIRVVCVASQYYKYLMVFGEPSSYKHIVKEINTLLVESLFLQ